MLKEHLEEIKEEVSKLARGKGITPSKLILPKNTIHFDENEKQTLCIVEVPPHLRTIRVRKKHYKLFLPYTIMIIRANKKPFRFSSLHVYARDKPLDSFKDQLYVSPLPNIYSGGLVCMTGRGVKNLPEVVDKFWQSPFTHHLHLCPAGRENMYRDSQDNSSGIQRKFFEKWQENGIEKKFKLIKESTLKNFLLYPNRLDIIKKNIINLSLEITTNILRKRK